MAYAPLNAIGKLSQNMGCGALSLNPFFCRPYSRFIE
jgi:hypothetical protein